MFNILSLAHIAIALLLADGTGAAGAAALPLSASAQADVRCSAAFAIVAGRQDRGLDTPYAALDWRGREYMVQVGSRLIDRGMSEADVAAAMRNAAAELEAGLTKDGTMLDAVMPSCLVLLDAEVPRLITPTLPQCVAILRRMPGGDGAAAALESGLRADLAGHGRSSEEADAILGAEAQAVGQVGSQPGGIGRYDASVCLQLAKAP